ncbi:MAG: DHH family phosphoesterase [Candidatus Methanoplasma sp.]|jgi:RecJ-like exonuclease|nr:DHH family phosphoesterase [Candidatus Methanoplasma sp.]
MDGSVPSKLLSDVSKAADIVRGHGFIHVFSHYDADGISAAAIICKALRRDGRGFKATLFKSLTREAMAEIGSSGADCVVVSDLGASYIREFDSMDCDVVVLDHHKVADEAERICYANPHLYGIDGSDHACGATMALMFAVAMDEANWDLVGLAFAGITGDRQHAKGIGGLNAHLLEEGVKRGHIKIIEGSMIPGGRLSESLLLCAEPYIRGVSGSEAGVSALLSDAGIGGDRTSESLTADERQRLSSLMAIALSDAGAPLQSMAEAARARYFLPGFGTDAETLGAMIDGCGRTDMWGVGLGAAMGDAGCLEKAAEIEREYSKSVIEAAMRLEEAGLTEMENIQWFDSSFAGSTGPLCGIASRFMGDRSKPVVGVNASEDVAKASARATKAQTDMGVDLSAAMREACAAAGGEGGGHPPASGGSFPSPRAGEFLSALDAIVGEQVRGARTRAPRRS